MKKIVLTGLPGCGKSLSSTYFYKNNIPFISSDDIVRHGYFEDNFIYLYLMKKFGYINKNEIVDLLFTDKIFKVEFEKLIFPQVLNDIKKIWDIYSNEKYCISEIPLYFEAKINYNFYLDDVIVIGINASENIRFNRVSLNRGWTQEYFMKLNSLHFNSEKKMSLCDFVIINESSKEDFINQLDNVMKLI